MIAEGQKPPIEFGPDKHVKLKIAAPGGFSSPIVFGNKLVITAFDGGKLYTIAYDRESVKEVWRALAPAKQIEAYHKTEGSPAASTSVTDGRRLVSYFGSCGLFCYETGQELWSVLGMPSTCCASAVVVNGILFFAGWSPGDAADKDFKIPSFDDLLKQGDANGILSKEESEKTFLKGFFDNNVLKAGMAAPQVVAKNPKLGERAAATPAIADDALSIHTEGHLYAFAVKK